MNLEQSITDDGRRKSRIVLPGTPEYEAAMKKIEEQSRTEKRKPKPKKSASDLTQRTMPAGNFDINTLINNGQPFYNADKDSSNNWIGVPNALEEAINAVGDSGVIANMPYLIAGKAMTNKDNYLWKNWFTTLSEENVGVDRNGKFVGRGKPVVITVHGGGILTPERIRKAYEDGLTGKKAAKLDYENEFTRLLEGILPSNESIDIFSVDDVRNGRIPNPFGRYAVWTDFEEAKDTSSEYHSGTEFLNNNLVLARSGTQDYLSAYFDKAKGSSRSSKDKVGNWHRLNEIDPNQAQGRLLFLDGDYLGLRGDDDLNLDGRFVGVGTGGANSSS